MWKKSKLLQKLLHQGALPSDLPQANGDHNMLSKGNERFLETPESIVKLTWERPTEDPLEKRITTQEGLPLEAIRQRGTSFIKREFNMCLLWSRPLDLAYMSNIESKENSVSISSTKKFKTSTVSIMILFRWVMASGTGSYRLTELKLNPINTWREISAT